jgi:FkbM family methyltransferase
MGDGSDVIRRLIRFSSRGAIYHSRRLSSVTARHITVTIVPFGLTIGGFVIKHDNLIIDVGMHTGEDTAFYLAKGFDVVAVEANPLLVASAQQKFAAAISTGRLRVLGLGIAKERGQLPLAVADGQTEWSSFDPEFIERNVKLAGTTYRTVQVPAVPFEEILQEVGIPRYLKIDIEGHDMLCVKALHHFKHRPTFVSLESAVSVTIGNADDVIEELAQLWSLGYRRFQYINQLRGHTREAPQPPREGRYADASRSHSGLFGNEVPGPWRTAGYALGHSQLLRAQQNLAGMGGRWSHTRRAKVFRAVRRAALHRRTGWYDLHAMLGR